MSIMFIYPKSYKTVERVIAYSYHPDSFPEIKNREVEIFDYNNCFGLGIDTILFSGGVDDIPKNLLKKRCKNLVQLDNVNNNLWRIQLI